MIRRRDFIAGLGGAAVASSRFWPVAARAQPRTNPTIGYLGSGSNDANPRYVEAFRDGLKESGYIENRNVAIEYSWAEEGRADLLPALARDLANRVTVIATYDSAAALAAKAATTTVPIVFATGGDPVRFGLVPSFSRPGGNVTGVSFLANEVGSKRLELLRELVPTATTFGFLVDRSNPNVEPETADMRAAANLLGRKLMVLEASTVTEIEAAFATFIAQGVTGLAIASQPLFAAQSRQQFLAELARRHRLPTIYSFRDSVAAGGLMSYGAKLTEAFRQTGIYTARILKGDKPADMPVLQVTSFEMVLNLKTAKELGLTVPNILLVSADELIE